MLIHITHIVAILCLATLAADRATAQAAPADVTFDVPVNLTNLPSEVTRIKLLCEIESSAILRDAVQSKPRWIRQGEVELVVSQSEVLTTAQVVVPLSAPELDHPSGKQATYECRLLGFHQSPQQSFHSSWHDFHTVPNTDAACRLTPKPLPITGSFVW